MNVAVADLEPGVVFHILVRNACTKLVPNLDAENTKCLVTIKTNILRGRRLGGSAKILGKILVPGVAPCLEFSTVGSSSRIDGAVIQAVHEIRNKNMTLTQWSLKHITLKL